MKNLIVSDVFSAFARIGIGVCVGAIALSVFVPEREDAMRFWGAGLNAGIAGCACLALSGATRPKDGRRAG
jgi:hypothetical protein